MALRIPLQSIVIQRDGKNMIPQVGVAFDFTEQELRDIAAVAPNAIRLPINEAASQAAADAQTAQIAAEQAAAAGTSTETTDSAAAGKADKSSKSGDGEL